MTSHDETKIRSWLTSRIGKGMKMGLETCDEMLDRLGRPEMDFPCIHVAGSNGKGTLCANLSSIGAKNGELIGVFTSPHLVNIEERTRIDGKPIKSISSPFALDASTSSKHTSLTSVITPNFAFVN